MNIGTRVRFKATGTTATVAQGTMPGVWVTPDIYVARGIADLFGPYQPGDFEVIEPESAETRGLTLAEAQDAAESLVDVFTPNGDAGVIDHLETREDGRAWARLAGRLVYGKWFDIRELETAETLRRH